MIAAMSTPSIRPGAFLNPYIRHLEASTLVRSTSLQGMPGDGMGRAIDKAKRWAAGASQRNVRTANQGAIGKKSCHCDQLVSIFAQHVADNATATLK